MLGRLIALGALVSWLIVTPAQADAVDVNQCITNYYKIKSPDCIASIIEAMAKTAGGPPEGATGLLSYVFMTDVAQRKSILEKYATDDGKKKVFTLALYRAGLSNEAKTFAEANGQAALLKQVNDRHVPLLNFTTSKLYPGDNDFLIGAYSASGDPRYIKAILANFTTASDKVAGDAIRLALVTGKFGDNPPKGRPKSMFQNICQRYDCKNDMSSVWQLLTLQTATWALGSLSQKDKTIATTVEDFFNNDARLKKIRLVEQNAFSNYLTTLAMSVAIKENALMNAELESYENFAPPKSAEEMMKILKSLK